MHLGKQTSWTEVIRILHFVDSKGHGTPSLYTRWNKHITETTGLNYRLRVYEGPHGRSVSSVQIQEWRCLCGTEMENLPSGWRLRPFVYELWIKAHPPMFCSSLVQLTWLPSNCLERKRTANTDVEDWLEFSKTVILLDLGRLEVLEPGRSKDRLHQTVNIKSNYVLLEC